MCKKSAGILLFRGNPGSLEVLSMKIQLNKSHLPPG